MPQGTKPEAYFYEVKMNFDFNQNVTINCEIAP